MQPLTPQTLLRAFLSFLLGLVVGALGTVVHRGMVPWGVLAALGLVLASAVMVRAWGGWASYVGLTGGVLLAVQVLSRTGPGGDVLVPVGDNVNTPWIGGVWIGGSILMLVLAAVAPRRWFDDTPRPPRQPRVAAVPSVPSGPSGPSAPSGLSAPSAPDDAGVAGLGTPGAAAAPTSHVRPDEPDGVA